MHLLKKKLRQKNQPEKTWLLRLSKSPDQRRRGQLLQLGLKNSSFRLKLVHWLRAQEVLPSSAN